MPVSPGRHSYRIDKYELPQPFKMELRTVQIAAVRYHFYHFGFTHDIIATEEGQGSCEEVQRSVTRGPAAQEKISPSNLPPLTFSCFPARTTGRLLLCLRWSHRYYCLALASLGLLELDRRFRLDTEVLNCCMTHTSVTSSTLRFGALFGTIVFTALDSRRE